VVRWKAILLSAVSGCAWAWIAVLLLDRPIAGPVWGGLVVSPVIGALAGMLSIRFRSRSLPAQAVLALASLYGAVALFAAVAGLVDVLFAPHAGSSLRRTPSAAIIESVLAIVWGMTLSGYVLFLWPLAWVNHNLIARFWSDARTEGVGVPKRT
jgi:NAD/NADP transhydrogenase beta subunit